MFFLAKESLLDPVYKFFPAKGRAEFLALKDKVEFPTVLFSHEFFIGPALLSFLPG